jgi:hypothetical protein
VPSLRYGISGRRIISSREIINLALSPFVIY